MLGLESKELQSSQDLEAALARAAASGLGKGSLTQNQALEQMRKVREGLINEGKQDAIRAQVESELGTGNREQVEAEVARRFEDAVNEKFAKDLMELQNLGSAPTVSNVVGSTVTPEQQAIIDKYTTQPTG